MPSKNWPSGNSPAPSCTLTRRSSTPPNDGRGRTGTTLRFRPAMRGLGATEKVLSTSDHPGGTAFVRARRRRACGCGCRGLASPLPQPPIAHAGPGRVELTHGLASRGGTFILRSNNATDKSDPARILVTGRYQLSSGGRRPERFGSRRKTSRMFGFSLGPQLRRAQNVASTEKPHASGAK